MVLRNWACLCDDSRLISPRLRGSICTTRLRVFVPDIWVPKLMVEVFVVRIVASPVGPAKPFEFGLAGA